jgi:hypothetical protein
MFAKTYWFIVCFAKIGALKTILGVVNEFLTALSTFIALLW